MKACNGCFVVLIKQVASKLQYNFIIELDNHLRREITSLELHDVKYAIFQTGSDRALQLNSRKFVRWRLDCLRGSKVTYATIKSIALFRRAFRVLVACLPRIDR